MPYDVPTKQELQKYYLGELCSFNALGERYGVSPKTAKQWLVQYGIPVRSKAEQNVIFLKQQQEERLAKFQPPAPLCEGEIVEDEGTLGSERAGPGKIGNSRVGSLDAAFDETSPWSKLTPAQVEAIALLSSYDPEVMRMTDNERCALIGCHVSTLARWEKDPNFLECLEEAKVQGFKSSLRDMARADILLRYKTGVGLTKEDRMLAFKLTGDLDDRVQVNYNVLNVFKDPRMGRF